MPNPRIVPALADLTQDIAGPVPVELLQTWAAGTQGVEEAGRLLDAYRIEGTVVASDTSGLSRMTEERDLLDVLALVSGPKQIVHGLGVSIGGRAIGIWVADNTEMYYPPGIDAALIVHAMSEAQARIESSRTVSIGMCVHCGEFYEVGGGLYGDDANTVEHVAEEYAGPGEVLVTRAVMDRLGAGSEGRFTPREDLSPVHPPGVYRLACPDRVPDLRCSATPYPHPFPAEFFSLLENLAQADDRDRVRKRIYDEYLRERFVVFVTRDHAGDRPRALPALLDDLVGNAVVESIMKVAMRAGDHVAGLGGGLAILTFDTPAEALEFAQAVRDRFTDNSTAVRIAIDRGPVLLFRNPRGPGGISGDAVNVASKLSEDCGTAGTIRITSRAARGMRVPHDARPFQVEISRLTLTGVDV